MVISATVVVSVGISIRPSRISYSLVVNEVSAIMRVVLNVVLSIPCGDFVVMLAFVVLFGGKVFVCFYVACRFVVRLGFVVASLLVVLLVYAALYWASLAIIPKQLIEYWASVNTTGLRPVLNMPMLIIYLTSPFNTYEALILHYPPWLYFIATVVMPTVVLALILTPVPRLCREGMANCVTVGMSFLTYSFTLAIATSYITSLITWLTLGKPGIGTSIYTVFMLASAVYVALYLVMTLLRRPRHLRRLPTRRVIIVLSLLVIVAVVIVYLIYKFLPLTLPHLIGLILTVIILTRYLTRHNGQARLIIWIASILIVIGLDQGIEVKCGPGLEQYGHHDSLTVGKCFNGSNA